MSEEMHFSIKKTVVSIIIVGIVLFLIIGLISFVLNTNQKNIQANNIVVEIRPNIILGDFREAEFRANSKLNDGFSKIIYISKYEGSKFEVTADNDFKDNILISFLKYDKILISVTFSADNTAKMGEFIFYFERFNEYSTMLLLWGLFVLVSIPLVIFYQDKIYKKQIKEIQSSKNTVIASTTQMLAHDVRKPFTILKGIISVLGDTKNPEEIINRLPTMLDEVQRSITSVDGLIKDVLEIGKSDVISAEPTNPQTLLDLFLTDLSKVYTEANIDIELELNTLSFVDIDSSRVLRIFLNIAGNAIEAMKYKGKLWFKTNLVEEDNKKFVEFRIGNNGPTIPEKDLPVLFEAFYTKNKKGGTGLGLAISKKIVEAHGGSIHCESNENTGTEFVFTLPALENKTAEKIEMPNKLRDYNKVNVASSQFSSVDEESRIERNLVSKFSHTAEKIKILLVDDEAIYRETLINLLKRNIDIFSRLEILEADNSRDALEIVNSKSPPQITILDIDLGKNSLNGIEIANVARANNYQGKLCIHSNRFLSSTQVAGLNVDKITRKPMERKDFLEIILSVLPEEETNPNNAETQKYFSVAIIEDNDSLRYLIKREIVHHANTKEYATPEAFLKDFENSNFDLIITDQNFDPLSKTKGIDLAKRLKSEFSFAKPIVLASLEDFPDSLLKGVIDATINKNMFSWGSIEKLLPSKDSNEPKEKLEENKSSPNSQKSEDVVIETHPSTLLGNEFAFARKRIPHENLSEEELGSLSKLKHDIFGEISVLILYFENIIKHQKSGNQVLLEERKAKIQNTLEEIKVFCGELSFMDFSQTTERFFKAPSEEALETIKTAIYELITSIRKDPYFTVAEKKPEIKPQLEIDGKEFVVILENESRKAELRALLLNSKISELVSYEEADIKHAKFIYTDTPTVLITNTLPDKVHVVMDDEAESIEKVFKKHFAGK